MRWCKVRGLSSGVHEELDAILRARPDHPEALALARRLAADFRPGSKRNPHERRRPRWARREVDLLLAAARRASLAQAAVIRARLELLPDEVRLNPVLDLIDRGTEPQRWVAAHLLGLSPSRRRVKPLYRRSLGDPSWQVRYQAVASLKRRDDGTTIGPWVKALLTSPHDSVRIFAAEALEQLGDARAVGPLIAAMRSAGSRPPRNNVVVTRQQAYVKDFDVEIAQAAVIADPIVDTVTEGSVLDVAVVSVTGQRRIIARSLRSLTGARIGADPAAWERWWSENRARFETR